MVRRNAALVMLASADGQPFTPVQIQKALFLLDREARNLFNKGDYYHFEPYDYGPFDSIVYADIDSLAKEGKAVTLNGHLRRFIATPAGIDEGRRLLESLAESDRRFVQDVSEFVRHLSFSELVTAIYRKYPDMKVNSVFVGA